MIQRTLFAKVLRMVVVMDLRIGLPVPAPFSLPDKCTVFIKLTGLDCLSVIMAIGDTASSAAR